LINIKHAIKNSIGLIKECVGVSGCHMKVTQKLGTTYPKPKACQYWVESWSNNYQIRCVGYSYY